MAKISLNLKDDIQRGLADAEAGRVTPHEEARARLTARYSCAPEVRSKS